MFRMKIALVTFLILFGLASFSFGQSCPFTEPASSNCLYPRVISGAVGQHVVLMDTHAASGTMPLSCTSNAGNMVYFRVTPEVTGWMTVSTCHPMTAYDTVLEVASGVEFCSGGNIIACNDDASPSDPACNNACGTNRSSKVTFYATAGVAYTIRVGSYNNNSAGCNLCLGLIVTIGNPCGEVPRNFICQEAKELPGTFGSHEAQVDVTDTPSNPGDWNCSSNVGHPVWFKFTSAIDGIATFTTCHANTTYDTVVRALVGDCGGWLAEVACNDDSTGTYCSNDCGTNRASTVSFEVNAGSQYIMEVGAYNNNSSGCDLCLGVRLTLNECQVDGDCDDGNPCTEDTCGAGTCEYGYELYGTQCTDDGNFCTDDICNGAGGCIHPNAPTGLPCGDPTNTACTNPDTCNGAGACLANNAPYGSVCADDGNPCTIDICNGSGGCIHPYAPAGTACGDPTNTACTNPDTCNGAGACLANNAPYGTVCTDDGNQCTTDICNGLGGCTHPYSPAGTACGDPSNTACTNPDTCNGAGACLANHASSGTPCPDGSFCNGLETCSGTGYCESGAYPCLPYEICDEDQDLCETITDWYVNPGDSIQAAIDAAFAAGGGTVHVSPGTYRETISLRSGVIVLGAGAGMDPGLHSIINSDTDNDGQGDDSVVKAIGVDDTAKIEGFLITNGSAQQGGGIFVSGATPQISNCWINDNTAVHGGGIYCAGDSPLIINTILSNNTADYGAGMAIGAAADPVLVNCTVAGNTATHPGGGLYTESNGRIRNSIIWANSPDGIQGTAEVTFSNVQGGYAGTGNLSQSPQFTDPDNGDYHLLEGSPCLDAGSNDAVPAGFNVDLEGNDRIVDADGNSTPDVDMGAYEAPLMGLRLSGYVYEGSVGDESAPFANVTVELYCAGDADTIGSFQSSVTTDDDGWYWLMVPAGCTYANILELVPTGYMAVGAMTSGGTVKDDNWIQYPAPLDGKVVRGNSFWVTEAIAPLITSGPTVTQTTTDSATIVWETDSPCDGMVRYGRLSGQYSFEATHADLRTHHEILLSGLTPSAIYHFKVESTNLLNLTVESDNYVFETQALPDSTNPTVTITDPGTIQDIATLSAEAFDNIGLSKVEFFLDDTLVFISYSWPYEFKLDTSVLANGLHTLRVRALDHAQLATEEELEINVFNEIDQSIPTAVITSHQPEDELVDTALITANLTDDVGLLMANLYFTPQGADTPRYYASMPFPPVPYHMKEAPVQFPFRTNDLKDGRYTIGIEVVDIQGKRGYATCVVNIANGSVAEAKLVVTNHSVIRTIDNRFLIGIEIENVGEREASEIKIEDVLGGFQSIQKVTDRATIAVTNNNTFTKCFTKIYANNSTTPGEADLFFYDAVPVLIHPNPPTPFIGDKVEISYKSSSGQEFTHNYSSPVPTTNLNDSIEKAHKDAVGNCDYLIVTNPQRLWSSFSFQNSPGAALRQLLSNMAQLAYLKQGVLGFYNLDNKHTLKNLMQTSKTDYMGQEKLDVKEGSWGKLMHPYFSITNHGYILLVGETEILPAWKVYHYPLSDEPYGTYIDVGMTERVVGRIIGDNPAELSKAIEASINVEMGKPGHDFDRSIALLVSGCDKSEYVDNILEMADILSNKGVYPYELHCSNYTMDDCANSFKNSAPDTDIIVYRGHGNPKGWSCSLSTGYIPKMDSFNFGDKHPFIFGLTCKSGNYQPWDDYGIAEAFLQHGAAVYVGSTEDSGTNTNSSRGKKFFNMWDDYESAGNALADLERKMQWYGWMNNLSIVEVSAQDPSKILDGWSFEYNLYGDPKFGAIASPPSSTLDQPSTDAPEPTIQITIPDYQVNQIDGIDHVEIPEGDLLIIENYPLIPTYMMTIDYPVGYEIQDVIMTDRSDLMTETGLNLPIGTSEIDSQEPNGTSDQDTSLVWWPEADYSWHAVENPDGTKTLAIVVYPFHYRQSTGDVQFYKNFQFDIIANESTTVITGLITDKSVYQVDEIVNIDLSINNSGPAEDVIVNTLVREYGLVQAAGSGFLESLEGLTGRADFSFSWNSQGIEAGVYVIEVTLQNPSGEILDRSTQMFELGITNIETNSFSAEPEDFTIGDLVTISMEINNTGELPVSGTVIMKVQDDNGSVLQSFNDDFIDLAPNTTLSFVNQWDSTGTEGDFFQLVGYVQYNSTSNDPITIDLGLSGPPEIESVTADTCISELGKANLSVIATDPEGGNLTYSWTPLDGGVIEGSGANVVFDPQDSDFPCPYQIEVTVTSDVSGLSTTQTVDVYVKSSGDANGDGVVNILDKVLIRNAFGQSGDPGWIPADVNADGVVNILDKVIVRNQFGQSGCACP